MKDFSGTPLAVGDIVIVGDRSNGNLFLGRVLPQEQQGYIDFTFVDRPNTVIFSYPYTKVALYSTEYRDATDDHLRTLFAGGAS